MCGSAVKSLTTFRRSAYAGMQAVMSLHPRNLTWNLKIMVSKWTFLFQGLIFRFHVKFRGCTTGNAQLSFFISRNQWSSNAHSRRSHSCIQGCIVAQYFIRKETGNVVFLGQRRRNKNNHLSDPVYRCAYEQAPSHQGFRTSPASHSSSTLPHRGNANGNRGGCFKNNTFVWYERFLSQYSNLQYPRSKNDFEKIMP